MNEQRVWIVKCGGNSIRYYGTFELANAHLVRVAKEFGYTAYDTPYWIEEILVQH